MASLINSIERKRRLQITMVILMIVVTSIWIPYNTGAEEYRHVITKKASRGLTFAKISDMLLRPNFELYNELPHKLESTIYAIPTAAAFLLIGSPL